MSDANKKRRSRPRQSWKPALPVRMMRGAWTTVFSLAKIALGAVATVVLILLVCAFVFVGILGNYLQNDIIPGSDTVLEGYDVSENSNMYYVDSDGNIQLLQKLYSTTNRQWIPYEDIPEHLINAAVAIEDKRFFQHQGVDWITTIKACMGMFFGTSDAGGSSITQQLIKNLTEENSITVQRKVSEIFRAITFEKKYDKEIVLEWYLNYIYLGRRCDGVKAAAEKYFGKEVQSLTIAECAALIGITNNPSIYDPYSTKEYEWPNGSGEIRNGFERNKYRKEVILYQMLEQGMITREEYDEAIAQEIILKDTIALEDRWQVCANKECDHAGTVSTYTVKSKKYYCPVCGTEAKINEDASAEVYSWFVDTVLEDVAQALCEQDGMEWNDNSKELYKALIGRSGYNIYTTLDMAVQKQVDKIYQDLSQIPKVKNKQQPSSAIIVIDNRTGDIVGMAGDVGKKDIFDAWNCATDAELQPGSSIKPLSIYAPSFETGMFTPVSVIKDMPLMYRDTNKDGKPDSPWPNNSEKQYAYQSTIFQGVIMSCNAVAVNTLDAIGTQYSFSFAKDKFGLSGLREKYVSENGTVFSDVDYAPLGLGAPSKGITVRDITAAYATFANEGIYREARTFTKVYDNDGNLILDNIQDSEQILSKKSVDYMNYCLHNAVELGTGKRAKIKGHVVAGKTGSTADYKDRWFCGFSDYYTASVWFGFKKPEVLKLVSTANPAAVLWNKVLAPLHSGKPSAPLYDTNKMVDVTICLDSGKLATDACRHDVRAGANFTRIETVKVYEEDKPMEYCDKHIDQNYCSEGHGAANEYCHLFERVGKTTITQKGFVKLTREEINEILAAKDVGMLPNYVTGSYVYLVDQLGNPLDFKGMDGTGNAGVYSPCLVCTQHTKEAWEQYLASLGPQYPDPEPEDTQASDPTDPEQ